MEFVFLRVNSAYVIKDVEKPALAHH